MTARVQLGGIAVATAVDTVGVLPVFLTGAMAVQLRDGIGLEVEMLGYVFAAYFGAAALFATPVGRLTDRIDPARFLRIGTGGYVVALMAMALATTPAMLMALIVLCGAGTALTRTASSQLVARSVTPARQGLAFGTRNSAIPVAALLSGLAVPSVALTIGWRWSFAIGAGLCVGVFLILPKSVPRNDRLDVLGEIDMSRRQLIAMATSSALASMAAVSLGAFTVVTAVHAGMSESAAGFLVALGSVIGVMSRVGVGFWSDRRTGSQFDVVIVMMALGSAGYGLIALGIEPVLWVAVPTAYATGWAFYGSYYLSVGRLNPVAPGNAFGIAQAGSFSGSIVGPMALGTLASRISFTAAWVVASIAALVASLAMIVVERKLRVGRR